MQFEVAIALAKFSPGLCENGFVIFCCAQGRVISGRPEFSRRHVAQIDERAPVIAGRILAPAGDGEIFPATISATGIADGDVITAIGKEMNLRRSRDGALEDSHDIFALTKTRSCFLQLKV